MEVVRIKQPEPLARGDALLAQAVTAYTLHTEAYNDQEVRYIIELCRAIINRNSPGAVTAARGWMYHKYTQDNPGGDIK